MREPKLVLRPLMRNDKQVVTCLSFDQEYNILLLQDEGMKAVVALAYSDGRLGGGESRKLPNNEHSSKSILQPKTSFLSDEVMLN